MRPKKLPFKNILLVLIGVSVLVLGISTAHATSPNAAIVIKGSESPACFGFVPISFVPLFTTEEIHETIASPRSDNITLTCHFNIPEGFEPTSAVQDSGFSCGIFIPPNSAVFTTDTEMIANPGGRATLNCQFKANQLQ